MKINELHNVEWNQERVERLWNYYGSNPAYRDAYFAKHSGSRILDEVDTLEGINGNILDIGCGPGWLLDHLASRTKWCSYTGVDTSESSLDVVRSKGKGAVNPVQALHISHSDQIKNQSIDTVFCVEVVEHCEDTILESIFNLIRRVLRPNGFMIVTTPNNEDLDRSMHVCPECGCVYHKWQHIRSWSCTELATYIEGCGFEIKTAFSCHFGRTDFGRGRLERLLARLRHRDRWREAFQGLPHAMVVARPRAELFRNP